MTPVGFARAARKVPPTESAISGGPVNARAVTSSIDVVYRFALDAPVVVNRWHRAWQSPTKSRNPRWVRLPPTFGRGALVADRTGQCLARPAVPDLRCARKALRSASGAEIHVDFSCARGDRRE